MLFCVLWSKGWPSMPICSQNVGPKSNNSHALEFATIFSVIHFNRTKRHQWFKTATKIVTFRVKMLWQCQTLPSDKLPPDPALIRKLKILQQHHLDQGCSFETKVKSTKFYSLCTKAGYINFSTFAHFILFSNVYDLAEKMQR